MLTGFKNAVEVDFTLEENKKKIEEKVADTGIQQILLRHLEQNGNNPEQAFSPEGIEQMNKNIMSLNNNGKFHHDSCTDNLLV